MLRKLTAKLKGRERERAPDECAAVPYTEPSNDSGGDGGQQNGGSPTASRASSSSSPGRGPGPAAAAAAAAAAYESGLALGNAAAKGDIDAIMKMLKAGVDVNEADKPDIRLGNGFEHFGDGLAPEVLQIQVVRGNTALHRAVMWGHSKTARVLLLHAADIDARNRKSNSVLRVAVESGYAGTVGVLLDYMHSVDNRAREPFMLLRSIRGKEYLVDEMPLCTQLYSFRGKGADVVQLLIAHAQDAEQLAVFLYEHIDMPVGHAFFTCTRGDFNLRNLQRFKSKAGSRSLTVLSTSLRVFDAAGYSGLRSLILVSCGLVRVALDGLVQLQLLDLRHNRLESLPPALAGCRRLATLRVAHNRLRRLPAELGALDALVELDAGWNQLKRLPTSVVRCAALASIDVSDNGLLELPADVGLLTALRELAVQNNKLAALPLSIAALDQLRRIRFGGNPLQNIPADFAEEAGAVRAYLAALQDDPVPNRTVKLVLVGQEGVGKTTLLRALKRTFWALPHAPHPPKTDGVDVKDIELDGLTLRCFDCGGDVDFNETHNFFITHGALYLACFNLSEYCLSTLARESFLLGRLQLWLQYIFSRVPTAQVLIVGTHADHALLSRAVFEQIWELLRQLLVSARPHHRRYFRRDRLADCLLCQADSRCLRRSVGSGAAGYVNMGYDSAARRKSGTANGGGPDEADEDETSFTEDDEQRQEVSFPHIVGYYEVSSVRSVGGEGGLAQLNVNQSIENVKRAVRELCARLTQLNPQMPRRWANVQRALADRARRCPAECVVSVAEVARLARAHGVRDARELDHVLHFLRAQGYVLFFPQLAALRDVVILDPEWLARTFASVVSFRDTGVDGNGFMARDRLTAIWAHVDADMRQRLLVLLRHFGVCLPVGADTELFPSKLPLGEPDDDVWPPTPFDGERQLTYIVTFPGVIPPPFFSELIVAMFRLRESDAGEGDDGGRAGTVWRYYANHIVDRVRLEKVGCRDCGGESAGGGNSPYLVHAVHCELIAHRRSIELTARGRHPCCAMKQLQALVNGVVGKYDGLGALKFDSLVCPGCLMHSTHRPCRFSAHQLAARAADERVVCANAHVLGSPAAALTGVVHESCRASTAAAARPKSSRDHNDFSGCPRLFVVLPVNQDGVSFDSRLRLFASGVVSDGFAAHFVCEFPDGYHLTATPGFRLRKPAPFMATYGGHVLGVLRVLALAAGSTVSPQYAGRTRAVRDTVDALVSDLLARFPGVKDTTANLSGEALLQQVTERGGRVRRDDLRRLLHVVDRADAFGPLRRLVYGEHTHWLCAEHYRQLRMLTLDASAGQVAAYVESLA